MSKTWTNLVLINLLLSLVSLGRDGQDERQDASPVTFQDVVARFEENNLDYVVLPLQGEAVIVISKYGGRILGPFPSKSEGSIYWINPVFADKDGFKQMIETKDLMIGGERIWIAPEIQYNIPDRSDFLGSYLVPEQLDPGNYQMKLTQEGQCTLTQAMVLKAYNIASGEKELRLERTITKAANPIRFLGKQDELMQDVAFIGYEHQIDLSESKSDDIMSEAWDLVQLNSGGRILIPSSQHLEYTDYFEPMPEDHYVRKAGHSEFKISGKQQYKVGLKAAHVSGRPSYFNQLPDGRAYLVICNFYINPSSVYAEEPPDVQGAKGNSVHIYNDDGSFGGFGELECNGQTIGGSTGKSSTSDQLVFWLYIGAEEKVKQITHHLLGISLQ